MFTFNPLKKLQWIAPLALLALPAHASDLSLRDVTRGDFDTLMKEYSSNAHFTTVGSASGLGGLGGFEVGLVGGITKGDGTIAIVKRSDPSSKYDNNFYHAGILGRVGLPYGFTAELLFLPKIAEKNARLSRWGIGALWTLNEAGILDSDFPVTIGVRGFVTKFNLGYAQTVTVNVGGIGNVSATADVDLSTTLWGVVPMVSYKIAMFEPFVAVGFTNANANMDFTVGNIGNTAVAPTQFYSFILNQSNFPGNSASSSFSSIQFQAGTDVQLAFFTLGAEYANVFGNNSYTARLSFRF